MYGCVKVCVRRYVLRDWVRGWIGVIAWYMSAEKVEVLAVYPLTTELNERAQLPFATVWYGFCTAAAPTTGVAAPLNGGR